MGRNKTRREHNVRHGLDLTDGLKPSMRRGLIAAYRVGLNTG